MTPGDDLHYYDLDDDVERCPHGLPFDEPCYDCDDEDEDDEEPDPDDD